MEVKRSEVQRLDAEHEVKRLKTVLDRQMADSSQLQVRLHMSFSRYISLRIC